MYSTYSSILRVTNLPRQLLMISAGHTIRLGTLCLQNAGTGHVVCLQNNGVDKQVMFVGHERRTFRLSADLSIVDHLKHFVQCYM